MERQLLLDFVHVTESSAIAASKFYGRGDKIGADKAATEIMRDRFNAIAFSGTVVIGEGEKDKSAGLFHGELVGTGGKKLDIVLDPIEGTTSVAEGRYDSFSVIVTAPSGTILPVPGTYMDQIVVGAKAAEAISLNKTITKNLQDIAHALKKDIKDVTVVILDRPRHEKIIEEISKAGARIKLIDHGTVAASIQVAMPDSGVDVLMGDAGAPEALLAACALHCLGGNMSARLRPHSEEFAERARRMGISDFSRIYGMRDLVKSDECNFVATGISDGLLLRGVKEYGNTIKTHSVIMRGKTKSIRFIETIRTK